MASIKGATSLLHTDYKVQREFERKGNPLFNKGLSTSVSTTPQQEAGNTENAEDKPITDLLVKLNSSEIKHTDTINFISPIAEYTSITDVLFNITPTEDDNKVNIRAYSVSKAERTLRGTIKVNKRPLDPNQYDIFPGSEYLFMNYQIRPERGYYGWYVYNIITHNMNLEDKYNYIVEFTDKTQVDNSDGADYDYNLYLQQRYILQHEPLDENRIIVYGVIKPYMINGGTESIPWFDESTHTIRTNIIFEYKINFGE